MEDITANHKVMSMQRTANDLTSHPTDCFAGVIQESSIVSGENISIAPDGPLTSTGPYYFTLPKNGRYIHGPGTQFYLEFKIVKGDGNPMTITDSCSFANCIASSFIQDIEVYIGHQLIPELTNTNVGHKTYLEYCMSFGQEAMNAHLGDTAMMQMDTHYYFDNMEPTRKADGNHDIQPDKYKNEGFGIRWNAAKLSGNVQCLIQFPLDLMRTCKYIAAGLTLAFKINRASDEFLLMSDNADEKYKLQVEKMELDLHYVDPADYIIQDHQRKLQAGQFIMLPFNKTIIKTVINNNKTTSLLERNLFFGTLPKVLLVAIIPHANFIGNYDKNALHFTHEKVKTLYVKINGGNQIPQNGYQQDFVTGKCIRSFRTFMNMIGVGYRDIATLITYDRWKNGITVYAMDFTPDHCSGYHRHEKREGHIDLHIDFAEAPTEALVIMALGVYDAVLGIDKSLQIRVDY